MSHISEQRRFLNEYLLEEFKSLLPPNSIVCDIGKTDTFAYQSWFKEHTYISVDRDEAKKPHLILDVEKHSIPLSVNGLILNGVFEQCDDPFALRRNAFACMKRGAVALLGLASIGMKPYGGNDKWRVTKAGATAYVKELKILHFYELPEYFYVIAQQD